jgi:molybdenum cofactor cytidylyltransferase
VADIIGILLAAGSATRFGSDKLMHPLADGTPIAVRSARNLANAIPGSLAVVRSSRSPLAERLKDEGLRIVECAEAAEGMGRTLAAGVRASGGAAGWVVALADMPYVSPATIRRVVEQLRDGAVMAAPAYRGERGHPVGFSAPLRAELEASHGDAGARAVLKSRGGDVTLVPVEDAGVLRDIDTPQDLEAN